MDLPIQAFRWQHGRTASADKGLSERLIDRNLAYDEPAREACRRAEVAHAAATFPICEDEETRGGPRGWRP